MNGRLPPTVCYAVSLVEDLGLSGSWHWNFITGEMRWSRGLFLLLGLDPAGTRASYDLLVGLVHPQDRIGLSGAQHARRGDFRGWHKLRFVRPNGEFRSVRSSIDIARAPDGKPLGATAIFTSAVDENRLRHVFEYERRERSKMYAQYEAYFFSVTAGLNFDYQVEAGQPVGLSIDEFNADPFARAIQGERERLLDKAEECFINGSIFQERTWYRRRDGELSGVRILAVPVRAASGAVIEERGLQYSGTAAKLQLPSSISAGLKQAVRGNELRSARGLLDWSMTDLAKASGLSLSTVRRLEENASQPTDRSRQRAIAALQNAGIRFVVIDNSLAVSKI